MFHWSSKADFYIIIWTYNLRKGVINLSMRFRRRRKIYKKLYESPRQVLFLFFAVGFSITVLSFMFFSLLIPKDIMHDIMNDSIKKIFMIITGMAIGLSVIDIFMVLIRKKNLDAVVFELETNDKYIGFYKIIPFILLILAVLSIAETGELTQFAIRTARDMLTEASRIEDEAARKELVRHAMQSENAGRLKAMIDVASNLEGLIINPDELDADIWKLNCKNGVVDLKTGELLPISVSTI